MTEAMDDETTVICPYCGQPNVIALDWGGATRQEYEEDCQVCCRAWLVRALMETARGDGFSALSLVRVVLDPDGNTEVALERLED